MAVIPCSFDGDDGDCHTKRITNDDVQNRRTTIMNRKWIFLAIAVFFVILCVAGGLTYFFIRHREGSSCPQEHCARCNGSSCTKCHPGWFASDCSHPCTGCWEGTCAQYSGTCIDCTPGFYTTSCHTPCPKSCKASVDGNKYCERSTGQCRQGCRTSFWGDRCSEKCSPRCKDLSCIQTNGHCLHGCKTGWYGVMCGTLCPENCLSSCSLIQGDCKDCVYGYRGPNCNITCHYCKDEDCTYDDVSMKITCTRGCKEGWTSTDCMARCNKGCKGGVCDMAGKCSCKDGFHGDTCSEPCPEGCKHNVCSKSGSCLYCADGGYGQKCEEQCPKACPKCDKTSGHCSSHNSGSRAESCKDESGLIPAFIVGAFMIDYLRMFEA